MLHVLAETPALPLDEAGKYVAAAYGVFVSMLVVYVAIIGARFARVEREVKELADIAEEGEAETSCWSSAPRTRRPRLRCASAWRCRRAARHRSSASSYALRRFTRR